MSKIQSLIGECIPSPEVMAIIQADEKKVAERKAAKERKSAKAKARRAEARRKADEAEAAGECPHSEAAWIDEPERVQTRRGKIPGKATIHDLNRGIAAVTADLAAEQEASESDFDSSAQSEFKATSSEDLASEIAEFLKSGGAIQTGESCGDSSKRAATGDDSINRFQVKNREEADAWLNTAGEADCYKQHRVEVSDRILPELAEEFSAKGADSELNHQKAIALDEERQSVLNRVHEMAVEYWASFRPSERAELFARLDQEDQKTYHAAF